MTTPDPRAAMQMAPTDEAWVNRLRETAKHLRNNSLSLSKYPGMGDEARARELASLYIGEIAELFESSARLRASLSLPAEGAEPQTVAQLRVFDEITDDCAAYRHTIAEALRGAASLPPGTYRLVVHPADAATPHPPQGRGAAGEEQIEAAAYTWPPKACPCNSNQKPECQEHGCAWERDPSLVPESLRISAPRGAAGEGGEQTVPDDGEVWEQVARDIAANPRPIEEIKRDVAKVRERIDRAAGLHGDAAQEGGK